MNKSSTQRNSRLDPSAAGQPYRVFEGTFPKQQSGFEKGTTNVMFNDFGGQHAFRVAFNNMKRQRYGASKASPPPQKLPVSLAYGGLLEQVLAYPARPDAVRWLFNNASRNLDGIVSKANGEFWAAIERAKAKAKAAESALHLLIIELNMLWRSINPGRLDDYFRTSNRMNSVF
ncbi:hypothetical protein DL771_006533 [Monosporascus sp. 5C6A]|nr:hypothetical protein DL771_006533 [Monosporascus sp. 5C6A]